MGFDRIREFWTLMNFNVWCTQNRVSQTRSTGRGGGGWGWAKNMGKLTKNAWKLQNQNFWGQNIRGDKPICTQWLQNWLHEHQCICNHYDHMRHERLKSYIGHSSLAGKGQTSYLNIIESSLRRISSHSVYSHNV